MNATAMEADHVLLITRVFDAPRELVWRAWTDPKHAINWWGPRSHPGTHVEIDARAGGQWRGRLVSAEDGSELRQSGTVREAVAPERLVFTFAWEEDGKPGDETLVTVTLTEEGGKTRMDFRQEPFRSVENRDGHRGGWNSAFDRLDDLLKG